ncbi:hypothetical protein [Levilactobacillus sp. N40-8-2]|uniref:hypothetical protein n=1 Tax=Levilactobacillus muriae TaxID=3238987 RepID=UPI0038B3A1D3
MARGKADDGKTLAASWLAIIRLGTFNSVISSSDDVNKAIRTIHDAYYLPFFE